LYKLIIIKEGRATELKINKIRENITPSVSK
jgi:hypothetical protein